MMTVPEHVQQRTRQQEDERQIAEQVCPVLAEEHHQGDRQKAKKDEKRS
jgi:hypothetical protein